jgi:hypothetical protein
VYKQLDEAGSSYWAPAEVSGTMMKLHRELCENPAVDCPRLERGQDSQKCTI